MTTLNDFFYTDNVDDVLAEHVNYLLASTFRSEYSNTETLSGTRQLLDVDTPIQSFDCNGADRNVDLPASDLTDNHPYMIKNDTASGAWTITIRSYSGTTQAVLDPDESAICMPNGSGTYEVFTQHNQTITNSISSVTTSNVTGVANTRHILDLSGLTANRDFILLAATDGDEIEVGIAVGDDTYHLIFKGDTGITINSGSAATEWNRTQTKGDTVRFVATSTSNWLVVYNGLESRKLLPSFEARQSTPHSVNNTTTTAVICDTEDYDSDGYYNPANGRFTPLVAGTYEFSGHAAMLNMADGKQVWVGFRKNGTTTRWAGLSLSSATDSPAGGGSAQRFYLDGVDDYVEMVVYHNHGSARDTYDGGNNDICHFGGHRIAPNNICGV